MFGNAIHIIFANVIIVNIVATIIIVDSNKF